MRISVVLRFSALIIFLLTLSFGVKISLSPTPAEAVACRFVGTDPKWSVYDALSCPKYGGGTYISICSTRCNFCEGTATCGPATAENPEPGCDVKCDGDGSTGGGSGPDEDMIWARIYTQDYNGGIRYFGSSEGVPSTADIGGSFLDRNVSINASTTNGATKYEGIWAGHFCGLGTPVGVTSDGRLGAVSEDVTRSAGAPFCCGASSLEASSRCYYGTFQRDQTGCSACQYDKNSIYSERCFPNDNDGCEQLSNIAPITQYPMFGSYDADNRHPLNKLFALVNDSKYEGESANQAMHPIQRYDKTPTYTIINTPENNKYDLRVRAPEGYYCYKGVGVVRYDTFRDENYPDSQIDRTPANLSVYTPTSENPQYPADGSYCKVEIDVRGGGSYMLVHVRKQIKGHVWGVNSSGNSVGLAGVRVQAYVGNSTGSINTYYGEGTTSATGEYFIRNDSMNLQSYQFYSVRVVSGAPAGYTGTATTVKWDDRSRTSGSIPNTWTGTGQTNIGSASYTGQATYWDNDCSSASQDGSIPGGRCDFAFRALPSNNPPTCTLQYRNTSGVYVPYNNSLTWPTSSNVYLRAVGTDPEGDSVTGSTYTQTCGTSTVNFSEVIAPNTMPYVFTTPSIPSTCVFTVQMRDTGSNNLGPACSISLNSVIPSTPGSLTLSTSSTLSKTALSGTVNSTVTGFSNPNPATLTIQSVGICSASIADCYFTSTGTKTLNFSTNGTYPITVRLKSAPFGIVSGGSYGIIVNYSPTGANASAAVPVADSAPTCGTYTFTTPSPYNGTVQFNLSASDDWSLRSFGSARLVNATTNSIVSIIQAYNASYWPYRNPVTTANDTRLAPLSGNFSFSTTGLGSGNYRIESSLGDSRGNRINCASPIFKVDTTPPVCDATNPIVVQTTTGTVVQSPTDTNNLVIKSTASDANSRLRRVTFYVVPTGTAIANITSPGVSVYTATVNVPNFATQVIGSSVTVTTPAPGWIVNTTPRNRYTIYAQWEDEGGNVPNGTNRCSIPFEIGTRYRVNVTVPSDSGYAKARYEDNTTEFKFIAKRNSDPWPALESTTPVPVGSIATGCRAQYPNGNPADDHGLCDSVYVTDTVFGIGDSSNIAVLIPGGVAGSKYVCNQMTLSNSASPVTYGPSQLTTFTHSDGQTYCSLNGINFPVQKATSYPVFSPTGVLTNASQAYPTEITIQLSYRTDAISGIIFDKNQNIIQPPIIPNGGRPNATYLNQAGVGRYFVLPGQTSGNFDASTFWVSPGNASFTVSAGADNMCFYEANVSAGLPTNNVSSVITKLKTRNSTLSYSPNCSISNYSLTHGVLSPVNQNKMNILVGPRMRIGPSDIDFVPNIDSCTNDAAASAFPYDMTATLSAAGSSETQSVNIPANTGTYNFNGVTLNFASSYNILFELNTSDDSITLSDFAVCNDNNRANPYVFSPMDDNSSSYFNIDNSNYGINYPNVSGAIQAPIRFYLKESNKWWQVYNGGVHSNSQLQLDSNDGSGDGMPSQAVIVGDPRPVGVGHTLPEGYDMYSALGISENPFIAGGLVSSFSFDPTSFDKFGLTDTAGVNNWNTTDFSNPPDDPLLFGNPLSNVFLAVKNYAQNGDLGYSEETSLNASIKKNKAYFTSNSDETINANININQPSDPTDSGITTFVDLSGSNTLTIRKDIETSSNVLIIYVNGNVIITPEVNSLNSVFIVATGEITVETAGEDLDNELLVRGGLYGRNVVFKRNLSDVPANFLKPATMVMFDQKVVNYSKSAEFSAEIKESKVYWILKE